jgi:SET domain-containing protein
MRELWYLFDLKKPNKETEFCIDGTYQGNIARFFNHSTDPNVHSCDVYVDNQAIPNISFFALRDIDEEEELMINYGNDFLHHAPL